MNIFEGNRFARFARQYPLFLIILLGFALRLAFYFELRHSPFFNAPDLDALEYDTTARDLAAGQIAWSSIPIHGPGYAFFLALIYALFQGSYAAAYWAQFVLGLLNVYLVYRLGSAIFDRTAGAVAAFLVATVWTFIYFEGMLFNTSLILSLDLGTLLALDYGRRSGKDWPWLLAGALLGLSADTWPAILAFLAGLCVWLLVFTPKPLTRPALKPAGLLLLAAAIFIAPVTFQNWRAGHDFVLIQRNGGLNFYLGNNASADGTPNVRPTGDWDQLLAKPILEAHAQTASAQDRFFVTKVLEFARTQPAEFFRLQLRKLALLFNAREIRATFDPEFFRRQYRTLSLPLPGFALVLALALFGMVLLRNPFPALLFISLGSGAAMIVATVVSSRYRMPILPALCLFAGQGAAELGRLIRGRDFRRLGLAAVFLAAVDLASHWSRPVPRHTHAEEYYHIGNAFLSRGADYQAEMAYRQALQEEPNYSLALTGLAWLSWDQSREDRAVELFRRALELDPANIPTRFLYAEFLRRDGKLDQALAEYRQIIRQWPADAEAYERIGMIYWQSNDLARARESFRETVRYEPGNAEAHLYLARIALERGERETARQEAEAVLRYRPGDVTARQILEQRSAHELGPTDQPR